MTGPERTDLRDEIAAAGGFELAGNDPWRLDAVMAVVQRHLDAEREQDRAELERLRQPDLRIVYGYDAGYRDAAAQIAQAIEADGFDPGRYTLTHPFGNTLRVMGLVRDDCARIARQRAKGDGDGQS